MSIRSVAGHQVVKNLGEPSEITLVHLDIYADYLREKDPNLDSRAVRALLTTGGPRLRKVLGHHIEVHGPYPILMNVDEINIYTKADVTVAADQVGQIYIGEKSLRSDESETTPCSIWPRMYWTYRVATLREGTIRHRSSGQCYACEHLDRHGF